MNLDQARTRILELRPEQTVIFVGAGMSVDLGLPSWTTLLSDMAKAIAVDSPELSSLMQKRLGAGDILRAADPAYEPEVRPETRVRFLENALDLKQAAKRRHRLLAQLPAAAFVTTNFDVVIERAMADAQLRERARGSIVMNGPDRFRRFNSNLALYGERYGERCRREALVLKIHNDVSDLESIVLSSRSMQALGNDSSYRAFYETMFRAYSVVFFGFGANDPNLLHVLASELANYAGFSVRNSYLVVPEGTPVPDLLRVHTHVVPVFYDKHDGHAEIERLLKDLGDAWFSASDEKTKSLPLASASAQCSPISVFELMGPAFRHHVDETIVDAVGRHMVARARVDAGAHQDAASLSNRLSQRFGIARSYAQDLVQRHKDNVDMPDDVHGGAGAADPIVEIADSLHRRAIVYDCRLQLTTKDIEPIAKHVLERAMAAFGGNAALSMMQLDSPRVDLFREEIRGGLNRQWNKVGTVEREALDLAFTDLFMNATAEEGSLISRLALTAVSFALIQSFPESSLKASVVPSSLFVDANIAIPLITKQQPRVGLIRKLIQSMESNRRRVCMLRGFLNEIASHYGIALSRIAEYKLKSIRDVRDYLRSVGEPLEYLNAFLTMLPQAEGLDEGAERTLRTYFGEGRQENFAHLLELAGVSIVETSGDPLYENMLSTYIMQNKKETYNRGLRAREILARNEARQIATMRKEIVGGGRPWFVTDDRQLRELVHQGGGLHVDGVSLLSLDAASGLLSAVSIGTELSNAYARMLWAPDWHDKADVVLAEAVRRLLLEVDSSTRIPIEAAKRYAVEELERRHRNRDEYTGAPEPSSEGAVTSVYRYLGSLLREDSGSRDR